MLSAPRKKGGLEVLMTDSVDTNPLPEADANGIIHRNKGKSWGKPFVKGDPRASKGGKAPRKFNQLRHLAIQIATEAVDPDGTVDTTKVEAIIRDWMGSTDFQKQKAALELAYGKVPDKTELTGKDGSAIEVNIVKRYADE